MERELLFVTDVQGRTWSFSAENHDHYVADGMLTVRRAEPAPSKTVLKMPIAQFFRALVCRQSEFPGELSDTPPHWTCCGTVCRTVEPGRRQAWYVPILLSADSRETARGRALTLLEGAYPFADGWTGHYVTDALFAVADTVEGAPCILSTFDATTFITDTPEDVS